MGVSLTINASNSDSYLLRHGAWNLAKRYGTETFDFTVRNTIFGATAYRPLPGDEIRAAHGSDLLFGGPVQKVHEYRSDGDGPIFVDVSCRGWELLAQQIILTGTLATGPLLTRAYALYLQYLQPKGVTWLGVTFGGPTIPDITYVRTSLFELYNRIAGLGDRSWRINGDKQLAFVAAGELAFPVTPLLASHFVQGVTIDQERYERATRVILQTGGTGEADHSEAHVGNGVKTIFALNAEVKPSETGPPAVHYYPTTVVVNGVSQSIGGGVWSYDNIEHTVFTSGAAVPTGQTVVVAYKISFPATVRVWVAGALNANGSWNRATLTDRLIDVSHITDVAQAKAWGDVELARRQFSPRVVRGATHTKGFYPLLSGPVDMPDHNINSASFLVRAVTVDDVGIDPSYTNHLRYHLELIEGDEPGRMWESLFQEYGGQTSGGGGTSVSGTGGSVGPSTPGTITIGALPAGTTIHLGGDNYAPVVADTVMRPIPQAIPNKFGGAGIGGAWTLNVAAFQLEAGTLQVELKNQTTGDVLATVSLTTVAAALSGGFGYGTAAITPPASVHNVIAQYRVTSGSRDVVIGHCTVTKD